MTRDVRRIAVFRALHLGDLLLAVPALRSLRAGFPEAEITLISLPWAEAFVRQFGHYVDRLVPFAGYPGIGEVKADGDRTAAFLEEQRAYGYDLIVQMHGSGLVSNRFVADLGGSMAAGYYVGEPPPGLDVAAPYPDDRHEVLRNLGLVALLGCPDLGTELEFPLLLEDRREAISLLGSLRGDGPLVGIHPGSRSPAKCWPPEYFAAVADDLVRRYGAQVILVGAAAETEIAHAVLGHMESAATDLTGRTSLGGLGAVLSRLDLFLSNDSGPAHIAYAARTPSITLFGPVDPDRWRPLGPGPHHVLRHPVPCSPCGCWECPIDHRCLRGIEPEQVSSLAGSLLRRKGGLTEAIPLRAATTPLRQRDGDGASGAMV